MRRNTKKASTDTEASTLLTDRIMQEERKSEVVNSILTRGVDPLFGCVKRVSE